MNGYVHSKMHQAGNENKLKLGEKINKRTFQWIFLCNSLKHNFRSSYYEYGEACGWKKANYIVLMYDMHT